MDVKAYYVSDVTGNRYPTEDYVNHGFGGIKKGFKDLPHDEYPYTIVKEVSKTEEELLYEFIIEVAEHLNKIKVKEDEITKEYDSKLNKALANWLIHVIPHAFKERGLNEKDIAVILPHWRLRELAEYVEFTDLIDFTTGKRVLGEMLDTGEDAWTVMERLNLLDKAETSVVEDAIDEVLSKFPDKVEAYREGKKGLFGMFVGEVMRNVKGVNGKEVSELLTEKLS